jgi:hypothetical protein
MFRDSRVGTIGAGTSEIMREIIAKMVIDDKNYRSAGSPVPATSARATAPAAQSVSNTGKATAAATSTSKTSISPDMTIENLFALAQQKADGAVSLGKTLRFDLEGDFLYLDGSGSKNTVSLENKPADCNVIIKKEHLYGLLTGTIQPMAAFMGGMFKVEGDMSVAMKLPAIFA